MRTPVDMTDFMEPLCSAAPGLMPTRLQSLTCLLLASPKRFQAKISAAWTRVVHKCGCDELYYCPSSDDIECLRHGGFDVCCNSIDQHVPVR